MAGERHSLEPGLTFWVCLKAQYQPVMTRTITMGPQGCGTDRFSLGDMVSLCINRKSHMRVKFNIDADTGRDTEPQRQKYTQT